MIIFFEFWKLSAINSLFFLLLPFLDKDRPTRRVATSAASASATLFLSLKFKWMTSLLLAVVWDRYTYTYRAGYTQILNKEWIFHFKITQAVDKVPNSEKYNFYSKKLVLWWFTYKKKSKFFKQKKIQIYIFFTLKTPTRKFLPKRPPHRYYAKKKTNKEVKLKIKQNVGLSNKYLKHIFKHK